MIDVQCRTCIRIREGYCDGAEPDDLNRPCEFYKRMTNADKYFRNATDEEIVQFLSDIAGFLPMYEGKVHPILKWLKEEVSDNG